MIPSYQSALAKAGTSSGFGLGQLLGQAADVMSAPRRWAWDQLGLGENGSDFAANQLGIDPESTLGMITGNAAEMVLDPINLLGPLAGFAGRALGKGMDAAKLVATNKASLASKLGELGAEKAALSEVGGLARGLKEAPDLIQNWPRPNAPVWSVSTPELAALKGPMEGVNFPTIGAQKAYNRASPEAVAALERSGMGSGLSQQGKRGAILAMDEKPAWLSGRGGSMQVDLTAYIPEYSASFSPPRSAYQALGRDEAASLASRLGQSADMMHAPIDELGGLASKRLENLGLDEWMIRNRISQFEQSAPPLGFVPGIDEEAMNLLANAQSGGIAAALAPLLMRRPRPQTQGLSPFPPQTDEPPLLQQYAPPEQLTMMPQLAGPQVFNR